MRILRLSAFLDYGGIESKMVNLSTYADIENTWIFASLGKGGGAESDISNHSKRVVCLDMPHRIPTISTIVSLFKLIREVKPDVIHCSGAEANFHGFIAAKLARVPKIVLEEIGIPTQSKVAKLIFKIIYFFADTIVGESKIVTDHLKTLYSISSKKLKTVPNFCILRKNDSTSKSENQNDFQMVSVSRLEPVKNLEAVIRVVHRLKEESRNVKYQILGDGSSMNSLKSLVKSLELEEQVTFVGFVKNPTPYLVVADLFVLNSFSEGFSNSLLEAMHLSVPSITSNVGAAQEIIIDGHNGWIVSVDNELELYAKIKLIMEMDGRTRRTIGVQGSEQIRAHYSLQAHIANLMDIYKN